MTDFSISTTDCQEYTEKQMPFPLRGRLPNKPTIPNFLEDFEVQEDITYSTLMAEVYFGRSSKETLPHFLV